MAARPNGRSVPGFGAVGSTVRNFATRTAKQTATKAATKVASRAATAVSSMDLQTVATAMLESVDKVAAARWDAAVGRAASLPGALRPEKVKALTDQLSRELAAVGAAAGVAAIAPAVGTTATLMASTAELAWFTTRCGDLILTIAALHGRDTPTVDERRAWVLAVLIYGGTAREGFITAADGLGAGLGSGATHLPIATLRAVNGIFGRALITRYGKKRGVIAIGRALPLGIGAAIGGGANWSAVRSLARQADRFFARMPYSAIDTTAIDIAAAIEAPRPDRAPRPTRHAQSADVADGIHAPLGRPAAT